MALTRQLPRPPLPTAPAAPASAFAPGNGEPEPNPQPARTTTQTSPKPTPSPIAVVSLLLGRRREPRHWLIEAHGDPAGLAARLQASLAEGATSSGPWANGSARAPAGAEASANAQAGAKPRAPSNPEQLLQRAFSDCTALERADPPSEASYRYRLSLPRGRLGWASVACWRRYGPGGAWQRRCGPMGLAPFLAHHGRRPTQSGSVHLY